MNEKKDRSENFKKKSRSRGRVSKYKDDRSTKSYNSAGYKNSDNDVSWYTKNVQSVRDVASLSYNTPVGAGFTLNHDGEGTASYTDTVPGILSILNMPVVGVAAGSADPTSPVNIAMRNIYSKVRRANSGAKVYEASDLMMYLMAMDSVYTFHAWMVRLYGMFNSVSVFNRYIPEALIRTQRISSGNLRGNLADFRAYINYFANRVNAFVVPNNMPIFIRHSWMYTNVYKDENVRKSQYYLYTPAFLNLFEVDSVSGAGKLVPYPICAQYDTTNGITTKPTLMTLTDIRTIGEALLTPLMNMEDFAFMSGDLLKAFGESNVFRLANISDDYVTLPTFSEEVLGQIHNTEFTGNTPVEVTAEGETAGLGCLTTTQITSVGGGELVFLPYFANARHLSFDKIIDSWKDQPTDEDTVVFSRNKITATLLQPSSGSTLGPLSKLTSCGSDIAFIAEMYYNVDGSLTKTNHYMNDTISGVNTSFKLLKFNELPICPVWANTAFGIVAPNDYFGEISNYTIASVQTMRDIHAAALMSLYDVPMNW